MMHKESIEALRRLRRSTPDTQNRSPKKQFKENSLRSDFKALLSKLLTVDTREQSMRELKNMVMQNKTTSNLRLWLSVLTENRTKNTEYEALIVGFIVSQYKKGLLDPIDKVPTMEKTIFRVCELLSRSFKDQNHNVQLACQKAWLQIYKSCLDGETVQTKKALVYDSVQAMINGGADRISQMTAQMVVDGLLEVSLIKDDLDFFREIAKPSLVLFLKTFIPHPASITALQTVLSFFRINNLLPLAQSIVQKIIYYVNNAPNNSVGYKIKVQCCNTLGLIGEQIDNGVDLLETILPVLEQLAIDKVWPVQVAGRKAVAIWMERKRQWDGEFDAKREMEEGASSKLEAFDESYNKFPRVRPISASKTVHQKQGKPKFHERIVQNVSKYQEDYMKESQKRQEPEPKTAPNFYPRQKQDAYQVEQPQFLQRNSGIGGGYGHVDFEPPDYEPHHRRIQQIKKQIFSKKQKQDDFDETVPFEEQLEKRINEEQKQEDRLPDEDVLQKWEQVMVFLAAQNYEQAYKNALQMDDDIYFIRCLLKTGPKLDKLTKGTARRVLKKMVQVMRSDFMNHLFMQLCANSIAHRVPLILQSGQNKQIEDGLNELSRLERHAKQASLLQAKLRVQLQDES